MKKLILSLLVFSATFGFAKEDCISRNGSPSTHNLYAFEDSLAGELDPYVLGDGGLLVFSEVFGSGHIVIYEVNEEAPYANALKEHASTPSAKLLITVRKDCLEEASEEQIEVMTHLSEDVLGFAPAETFYVLEEY
ncbi:MAG: hypothetical protein H6621_10275 [Halobacteriovoraceae bacterium]|nr:hypothetical protein [Halobacteriovoraceae bacterium]MCB9095442.1 hypothetical protein [Halobacteriovoraceae bacterium]